MGDETTEVLQSHLIHRKLHNSIHCSYITADSSHHNQNQNQIASNNNDNNASLEAGNKSISGPSPRASLVIDDQSDSASTTKAAAAPPLQPPQPPLPAESYVNTHGAYSGKNFASGTTSTNTAAPSQILLPKVLSNPNITNSTSQSTTRTTINAAPEQSVAINNKAMSPPASEASSTTNPTPAAAATAASGTLSGNPPPPPPPPPPPTTTATTTTNNNNNNKITGNMTQTEAASTTSSALVTSGKDKELSVVSGNPIRRRKHVMIILLVVLTLSLASLLVLLNISPDLRFKLKDIKKNLRRALYAYIKFLHAHPLSGRAITCAILFFHADFLAQKIQGLKYSLERNLRYMAYGCFINGPFLYAWYNFTYYFGPPDNFLGSLEKAIFEQLTMEPIVMLLYYIYDTIVLRKPFKELKKRLSNEFFTIYIRNGVYWLPANFLNYYLGTPDLRVLFANMCSFFWQIYFSFYVNQMKRVRK